MNCLSVFDHFVGLALKGLKDVKKSIRTLIKKDWPVKYIISRLSKLVSTKGIYGTGIKKLKHKKIRKRISGIILLLLA